MASLGVEGAPWFSKWNAGSWPAPPVQDANSTGWAAADVFAEAECEACWELLWLALLPGSEVRSRWLGDGGVRGVLRVAVARAITGCVASFDRLAAPIALADAECDGCEWPWPGVTSGSVTRWPLTPLQLPSSRRACEWPWPAYDGAVLPGRWLVRSIALADAECDRVLSGRGRV